MRGHQLVSGLVQPERARHAANIAAALGLAAGHGANCAAVYGTIATWTFAGGSLRMLRG